MVDEGVPAAQVQALIEQAGGPMLVKVEPFVLYRGVSRPLQRLLDYAKAVQAGERVPHPRLGRNEMGRVAEAMAEMRSALDGKGYIADYVQARL